MCSENQNNPTLLNNFLNTLIAKGFSEKTVIAYNGDLNIFFEFIKQYSELKIEVKDFNLFVLMNIKKPDIIAFLTYLNFSRNNTPSTIRRRLSAMRTFYDWLLSTRLNGYMENNPTAGIESAKIAKVFPKYLNLEQAKQIQTIFNRQNSKFYLRNNTIISLFLSTGMRVGELISINVLDVNFKDNSILIIGKGNVERKVYFNELCKKRLKQYLKFRNKIIKEKNIKENALFINKNGNRLGIRGVEDICRKAYKLIGIEEDGYSVHTLRHTAATIMYKHTNSDILLVKQFLGHKSLLSTEIYTHIVNEEIRDITNKNPLSNYEPEKNK